jgi:hypothetical protein
LKIGEPGSLTRESGFGLSWTNWGICATIQTGQNENEDQVHLRANARTCVLACCGWQRVRTDGNAGAANARTANTATCTDSNADAADTTARADAY